MGDVNLEIKLNNIDERVIKIEESGGSGGDGYITSVSNDFNVLNKRLSLSNDVTTKLSNVDDKIDKPASATNGQVLTYNGTSKVWEAQDSKGGADDTSIISDAYDESKSYVAGEYCIYNNLLWKCLVQHNGQTPTEGTYWTNVSVANEIASVNSSLTANNSDGTFVDLSSYNSESNKYTFPSDGYLVLSFEGVKLTNIKLNVLSASGIVIAQLGSGGCVEYNMYSNDIKSLFVKKGMSAYVLTNSGGKNIIRFYPIS